MIEIKNLTKVFPTQSGPVTALEDVSLTIGDGQICGIIGMSGAGKSTLVRCINYLEEPTLGSVTVDGCELGRATKAQLAAQRRKMGMVFQHFNLLMQSTVLDNVLFPLRLMHMPRVQARERAMELLTLVGLETKAKAYPAQLSGGQKQRVAIARALATQPSVLLCDEATSALDPMTTRSILELLRRINRELGLTVVIITHEMAVIREICTHVAVMDNARLVESGPVEQVFTHPRTEAALRLFYPDQPDAAGDDRVEGPVFRVVFDGQDAMEPYVAQAILTTGVPLNILQSNLVRIGGRVHGFMIISLPEDEQSARRVMDYFRSQGLTAEGVGANV